MKKILFVFMAVLTLIPMILSASANDCNGCYGSIPMYEGTITQDGAKDEAYENYGKHFTADAYQFIRGEALPGYSANFWWLFTDDYKELHVYVEVIDPTILVPTDWNHQCIEMCHHVDCIELFIDPTNELCGYTNSDDGAEAEAYNYRMDTSGYPSGHMWGNVVMGEAACAPYFEGAMQMNADGYNFEFLIHCDVFEQSGQTELKRGSDWGIQMLATNVYDELQYEYENKEGEHRWDTSIYRRNSFTVQCSCCPEGEASYNTADFDYILLGNTVSDEDEPITDDTPDSVVEEVNGGKTDGTGTDGKTNGKTNGGTTVNKVGDGMAVSAVMLILSAGAVVLAKKKRR